MATGTYAGACEANGNGRNLADTLDESYAMGEDYAYTRFVGIGAPKPRGMYTGDAYWLCVNGVFVGFGEVSRGMGTENGAGHG